MTIHRAAQGECLSTIAARYGFSRWQALFNHPDNAALEAQRKSPNLLEARLHIKLADREYLVPHDKDVDPALH